MDDLSLTLEISRSELNLGPLEISTSNGYYVARDGFGPGEQVLRRITAESPYVSGRILTHAVKAQETTVINLRVKGNTSNEMWSKIEILQAAVAQFSYTITFNLDGYEKTWRCEPADVTIGEGGQFNDLWIRSNTQKMSLSIPHLP